MTVHLVKSLLFWSLIALLTVTPIPAEGGERAQAGELASSKIGVSTSASESEGAAAAQLLDTEEAAELEARAEEPGEEVAGGALNNQQLTYIVIALAAAVVVLVLK